MFETFVDKNMISLENKIFISKLFFVMDDSEKKLLKSFFANCMRNEDFIIYKNQNNK